MDGGGADVVDIRRRQCSLPGAMPEATPAGAARSCPRFDEARAAPACPPLARQDGVDARAPRRRDAAPPRAGRLPLGPRADASRPCASTSSRRRARSSTPSTRATARRSARSSATCSCRSSSRRSSARREGSFAIDDVVAGIVDKLVHRHPHVFGDVDAKDADEVLRNWEKLKAQGEGRARASSAACRGACRRSRARSASARRSRASGFDWEDARGSRAKVDRGARRARPRHRERRQGAPSRRRWATCSSRS